MEKESSEAAEQLAAARAEKEMKDADRTRLLALFNATEDGAAFLLLKEENKVLVGKSSGLRPLARPFAKRSKRESVRRNSGWARPNARLRSRKEGAGSRRTRMSQSR